MATTDSVIINLLIKEQGVVGAINSQKTLAKQTIELIKLIDNLAERYKVDTQQIVRSIETYNNKIAGGTKQGTILNPNAVGMYKLEIENIEKIRAAQAQADREREEAQKRRMIGIQQEAIKKNEEFEREKLQEAELQKVKNAVMSAAPQLSTLAGKTPYGQTKLLVPLMQELSSATGASTDEMLKLVKSMYGIDAKVVKNVANGLHDVKNGVMDTAKEMFNLKSIMNTAFGVGMAMLIFQLQMLISKFFTDTIQQAKDLSNAIGKISIAEQVMSKEGIEVTGKDMLKIVSDLEKEFTNVSNVDMLKATGDMALRLAGTGFTPEELKGLLEVANAAKIRNPERSLEDIMGTVSAAAMSGQVEGVRNLGGGLSVAASDVQAYALKVGMIKNINDKLTEEQKLHARAGVLIEQNNKSLQETLKLQENLANAGDKLGASWKNLTEQLAPLVDIWNAILFLLSYAINGFVTLAKIINGTIEPTNNFQQAIVNIYNAVTGTTNKFSVWFEYLKLILKTIPGIGMAFSAVDAISKGIKATWDAILWAYEKVSGKKVSEQPSIANVRKQDTPTGPYVPPADDTEDNADKISKALNDLAEAMDQFAQRAARMEEDFANTMRKLQEDFNIDQARFLQDWAIDRQKIISDSEEEMARKQRDYNNRKKNAEAKFQEDLRQLREKYLMNLDDALHERDARQVLRLAREYAMNKQNLINEFNISQADSDAQHKAEMEDLLRQRNDRLKALDEERALKLKRMQEDFALKKKREEEQHKLEMQRLEQEREDKIRQLAQSLSEQLKLSGDGSKAIYDLFMGYFGPKGAIPNIMDGSYKTVVAYAERMAKKLQEILDKFKAIQDSTKDLPGSETPPTPTDNTPAIKRANGALDIANKPTSLLFGEAGPEMALTVPLNQLSTLKSGILGSFLGGNQSAKMELLVSLSDGLEAKIVNKSVDAVSDVVMKVRRNTR